MVLATVLVAILCGALAFYLFSKPAKKQQVSVVEPPKKTKRKKPRKAHKPTSSNSKSSSAPRQRSSSYTQHSLFVCVLKGHHEAVHSLEFAPHKDKHQETLSLLSASEDRTFRIWHNWLNKNPPYLRVGLDNADSTASSFGADGKLVVSALNDNQIEFHGLKTHDGKLKAVPARSFDSQRKSKDNVSSVFLFPNKKWVLTCCRGEDTEIRIHSVKGEILHSLKTNQLLNYSATLSQSGEFFAVASRMADVNVWHVESTKTGDFKTTTHAMTFRGHKGSVNCVSFSSDASVAVTACHDGTFRCWNTAVRWREGEESHLLCDVDTMFDELTFCCLQPGVFRDTLPMCAVTSSRGLAFYDLNTEKLVSSVPHIPNERHSITAITWSPDGNYVAIGCTDSQIYVFRPPSV